MKFSLYMQLNPGLLSRFFSYC